VAGTFGVSAASLVGEAPDRVVTEQAVRTLAELFSPARS
jgi:hypothetical protein